MSPNQERMSVRLAGVGKLRMALRNFRHGHTLSGVISNPANSAVSALSTIWIEDDAMASAKV